jgi:Cutinase
MHGAVAKLDQTTKSKLVAGVMFGDSMNGKHNGKIQNFPADKVLQVCHDGDGICAKRLAGITAAHLNYASGDYSKAVDFMASKINGGGFSGRGKGGKGAEQ